MMDANVYGKKQYWILMGIAAATSLLSPLFSNNYVISSFCYAAVMKVPQSLNWVFNMVLTIGQFSIVAGSAVLIFTVMRYRFRLCLPLVAIPVICIVSDVCLSYLQPDIIYSRSYLFTSLLALISCVGQLAEIGIIKVWVKHIKKEAFQIIFILFCLFVAEILFTVMCTELDAWRTGQNISVYGIRKMIVFNLFEILCMAFFYLVLRVLFAHDRRQTVQKFFASVKAEVQKSIE